MQSTDLKLYKSAVITDTAINGGRESYVEVQDNVLNNLFPSVSNAERTAGGSRLRKAFFHNVNSANEALAAARAYIKQLSTAGDHFILIEVSAHAETQGDLTGSEKQYGSGELNSQGNAGATQIVVDFDDANDVDLADGDMLWLYGTNGEMFNEIDTGGVSWNGNQATIDLVDQLNVDYPAGSICAMVLECGTLEPTFDNWSETSASGTYDETSYPPELENEGTVEDEWTLTFTSATDFDCVGTNEGSVGSGSTSSDFAPTNPNTSTPYFTLRSAGWAGTWASGDTVVFQTHPASKGIWIKEIWPAGVAAASNNQMTLQLYGE